jgi:hypothetical protein
LADFYSNAPDLIQLQGSYGKEEEVHPLGYPVLSQHVGRTPSGGEHSDIQRHCKTFCFREDQLRDIAEEYRLF